MSAIKLLSMCILGWKFILIVLQQPTHTVRLGRPTNSKHTLATIRYKVTILVTGRSILTLGGTKEIQVLST